MPSVFSVSPLLPLIISIFFFSFVFLLLALPPFKFPWGISFFLRLPLSEFTVFWGAFPGKSLRRLWGFRFCHRCFLFFDITGLWLQVWFLLRVLFISVCVGVAKCWLAYVGEVHDSFCHAFLASLRHVARSVTVHAPIWWLVFTDRLQQNVKGTKCRGYIVYIRRGQLRRCPGTLIPRSIGEWNHLWYKWDRGIDLVSTLASSGESWRQKSMNGTRDFIVFNINRAYQCNLCQKYNYNPLVDRKYKFCLMKDKRFFAIAFQNYISLQLPFKTMF